MRIVFEIRYVRMYWQIECCTESSGELKGVFMYNISRYLLPYGTTLQLQNLSFLLDNSKLQNLQDHFFN